MDENLLNVVTGLSGSSPAFVFMMIEAMSDAGVLKGLSRPVAIELAAKTVLGAAKMVLETKKHPGQLKDMITSPAGTTIAGVARLERDGFRNSVISAVQSATERAEEMK